MGGGRGESGVISALEWQEVYMLVVRRTDDHGWCYLAID